MSDNLPLALRERISGELTVKANLKGSKERSPVLYPGLQLVMGNLSESGDYVTRSITAGTNTKITITYDALIPGTADVKSYVEQSAKGWQLVNLTSGKPIGENWVERTHVLSSFNANETRIKLVLSGTVVYSQNNSNIMNVDQTKRGYPLPHPENITVEDVVCIRTTIEKIDEDMSKGENQHNQLKSNFERFRFEDFLNLWGNE